MMTMSSQPGEQPKITSIRVDPELREWLDAFAADTMRSLNGAVNYLLKQARAEIEKAKEQE